MRKVIALILGCLISVFICKYWSIMASHMDSRLAYGLMVYVVAMGIIHLGGI